MEKRRDRRVTVGYKTEILYDNNSYTGVIENISASGVNVLTDPLDSEIDFIQYDSITLKFQSPKGEEVTLDCTIMWSSTIPPNNARHRIGMELVGRPWDKISFFL